MKNRQYNSEMKKDKQTNNDPQNTVQKTKTRQKLGVNSVALEVVSSNIQEKSQLVDVIRKCLLHTPHFGNVITTYRWGPMIKRRY